MALLLFPAEVWELILGELENTQDILNVFQAYPELKRVGILRSTRHIWLFEQIFPSIFPWLAQEKILACRKVCGKWSRGVDKFLDCHSTTIFHQPQNQHMHEPENRKLSQAWLESANSFCDEGMLTAFLQKMDGHPPNRNPFMGRCLVFEDYRADVGDSEAEVEDPSKFWNLVVKFLGEFGNHVWFLKLGYYFRIDDPIPYFKQMAGVLRGVPNLRGLELSFCGGCYLYDSDFQPIKDDLTSGKEVMPALHNLESLVLISTPGSFANIYIAKYSMNITRLTINQENWEPEYNKLFPRLAELTLLDMDLDEMVIDLLQSLEAPELSKLTIRAGAYASFSVNYDMAECLKKFPRLISLELSVRHFRPDEELSSPIPVNTVTTLKSLILIDSKGVLDDLQFLQAFPSLEYFKVRKCSLGEYMGNGRIYAMGIWESLPSLKETVLVDGGGDTLRFTRAQYELYKIKRQDG